MGIDNLRKAVGTLAKLIEENEKIALPIFSVKLARASRDFPEDHTIGMMSGIVARMSGSNKLFISRAEIKDLYEKLYTRNTKFAQVFKDELGVVPTAPVPTTYNREGDDENLSIIQESYDKIVDPVLANALQGAFGSNINLYTETAKKSAERVCSRIVNATGATVSINVVNGKEDLVICNASFDTPKGTTSVLIPVEILDQKALIPSVFIGNEGPETLSTNALSNYVSKHAGEKLKIHDIELLKAVSSLKDKEKISSVDLALTKLNSEKETKSNLLGDQILFQKVETVNPNLVLETPTYKDQEIESFAKKFDSELGIATFKYGTKVTLGRNIISKMLSNFGFDNHQISVVSCDAENGIVYAVSMNDGRTGLKVPVKIDGDKVLTPNIFIANGSIDSFDKKNVQKLLSLNISDLSAAAAASPLYGLKASELVNTVRTALAEENYAKAEDALNIISEMNDDKAYDTAFSLFTENLNKSKKVEAEPECKCSRVVKSAHSQHLLCGHTNLPLHKVYQDKNGDCHPLYRKGMEETREGAYFMNSKIFF